MLPTMLIPPLQSPLEYDLYSALSNWLEKSSRNVSINEQDLQRISSLRTSLVEASSEHSQSSETLSQYQEYHACLFRCLQEGYFDNESFEFPWRLSDDETTTTVSNSLQQECSHVLWNIACILSHQASIQEKRDRAGWNQAHLLLQDATSILQHLVDNDEKSLEYSDLQFWHSFLLAQAQIATYYMALASPKPRHFVLAKLAYAAHTILQDATSDLPLHSKHEQAWSTWMLALAQYHESSVCRQKKMPATELARLQRAQVAIRKCQKIVHSTKVQGMEMLKCEAPKMVKTIHDRLEHVQQDFDGEVATTLKDIRGERLVKKNLPLPRACVELDPPLFQTSQRQSHALKKPPPTTTITTTASHHNTKPPPTSSMQDAIERFHAELQGMIKDISTTAQEDMERARQTLANAHLPHSLTAYKQQIQQQSSGNGGVPLDVWERIQALQESEFFILLKTELWELRQGAELAMTLVANVAQQLDQDANLDDEFRQENAQFQGHVAVEVQRSFRNSLQVYQGLLQKSRDGDETLVERLSSVDKDPKFKLLRLTKMQLDQLLPASQYSTQNAIDTTQLARLLVALSSLFDEREQLLDTLQQTANEHDVESKLQHADPSEYNAIIQESFASFGELFRDIRTNISRQEPLVDMILQENQDFVEARNAGPSPNANENCILMIEDALEEAEQLKRHLSEGREFYNVVIGKLQHLQHEVGDASARLAIERCEYEDTSRHRHQESDDARLAASLADASSNGDGVNGNASPHASLTDDGQVLDDAKVANLVAMDFDPNKVVTALKKHNNDMDRALNELL